MDLTHEELAEEARVLVLLGQQANEWGKPHAEVQNYTLLSIAHSLLALYERDRDS
jgi:hypothetical protein